MRYKTRMFYKIVTNLKLNEDRAVFLTLVSWSTPKGKDPKVP